MQRRQFLARLLATAAGAALLAGPAALRPGSAGASPLWAPATTTADLNLRAGPGTTYPVLTVMPAGSRVEALAEASQNGFFPVRYGGYEGWASATYLAVGSGPGDPGGDPGGRTARVTTALNLRAGAGTGYGVVLVMPAGSTVTITGESVNGFAPVAYNGTYGWAYEAYLDPGDGPDGGNIAVATTDLNLRAGPSLSDWVILVMPAGSRVTVTGERANGFLAVVYSGIPGWAYATYLG